MNIVLMKFMRQNLRKLSSSKKYHTLSRNILSNKNKFSRFNEKNHLHERKTIGAKLFPRKNISNMIRVNWSHTQNNFNYLSLENDTSMKPKVTKFRPNKIPTFKEKLSIFSAKFSLLPKTKRSSA